MTEGQVDDPALPGPANRLGARGHADLDGTGRRRRDWADAGTPRHLVSCLPTTWRHCPFDGVDGPIPGGARPHTESDGAMVVMDEEAPALVRLLAGPA